MVSVNFGDFFRVFAENQGISIDAYSLIVLGFNQFKGVIVDE